MNLSLTLQLTVTLEYVSFVDAKEKFCLVLCWYKIFEVLVILILKCALLIQITDLYYFYFKLLFNVYYAKFE